MPPANDDEAERLKVVIALSEEIKKDLAAADAARQRALDRKRQIEQLLRGDLSPDSAEITGKRKPIRRAAATIESRIVPSRIDATLQDAILHLMRQDPERVYTALELYELLPSWKHNTVRMELSRLHTSGQLERLRFGQYKIAENAPSDKRP